MSLAHTITLAFAWYVTIGFLITLITTVLHEAQQRGRLLKGYRDESLSWAFLGLVWLLWPIYTLVLCVTLYERLRGKGG